MGLELNVSQSKYEEIDLAYKAKKEEVGRRKVLDFEGSGPQRFVYCSVPIQGKLERLLKLKNKIEIKCFCRARS